MINPLSLRLRKSIPSLPMNEQPQKTSFTKISDLAKSALPTLPKLSPSSLSKRRMETSTPARITDTSMNTPFVIPIPFPGKPPLLPTRVSLNLLSCSLVSPTPLPPSNVSWMHPLMAPLSSKHSNLWMRTFPLPFALTSLIGRSLEVF